MKRLAAASLCLGISLLIAGNARSNETISTSFNDFYGNWGPGTFSEYAEAQSFTVPADATELLSFTFTYLTTDNATGFDFVATIYAFNSDTNWASGSALWTSSVQSISSTQVPFPTPSSYTFTPNLAMTEGQTYLMIVSSGGITQVPPGQNGQARVGVDTTNSYAGGALFYRQTFGTSSNYTTGPWSPALPGYDAAFSATFATVPEPSVLGLATVGLVLGAGFLRSRRSA